MTQRLTGEKSGELSNLRVENKAFSVKEAEYYTTV